MKRHIPFGLLAATLAVTIHAAQAESFRDRQIDERFAAADKNNDGKLTLDEARARLAEEAAADDVASDALALLSGFLPSLLLSGFLFEIDSMPTAIQWLTYIVPARYLIPSLQSVFLVGDVWQLFLPNIAILLLFGAFFFLRVTRAITRRIA